MNSPAFTIFIPTYNGGAYLKECLESAVNQEYNNFNIIVLDSGSQDNTLEIAGEFCTRYRFIEIIKTDKRLNIFENWHRILSLPKNEWMTILGQDDVLNPDFLKKIAGLILTNSSGNLYFSHFNLIDEKGIVRRACYSMPETERVHEFVTARFLMKRDSFATGYVIRSGEYERSGGIEPYPDLLFADDALWVKLSLSSSIIISPEFLFRYRFHFSSTSGTPNQDRLTAAGEKYLSFLTEKSTKHPELAKAVKEHAQNQFIPVLRAYFGLAVLFYTSQGSEVPASCFERVKNMCALLQLPLETVTGSMKYKVFSFLQKLPARKQLTNLIFKLFPSLRLKAKF